MTRDIGKTRAEYRKRVSGLTLGQKVRIPEEISKDGKSHTATIRQLCTNYVSVETEKGFRESYSFMEASKFIYL